MKYRTLKATAALLGAATMTAHDASAASYSQGHADFGIAYLGGGTLDLHFHAEGATIDGTYVEDQEYEISDVTVEVSENAMVTIPIPFAPLGVSSGATVWVLPETENVLLPFLGIGTEELSASDWSNLTITLGAVSSSGGTGHFALWQTGSFGETLLKMSTADPGSDSFGILAGGHGHYNWGFSEAGEWEVEFTVSGNHAVDGFATSSQTLRFNVVPEPSSMFLLGFTALGLLFRRR